MPQLSLEITHVSAKDGSRKKRLIIAIHKKRAELKQLVIKVELLRVNLQLAQNEYMVKVGNLLLKDSHLDLEIIRYKNILHLMKNGYSYEQAVDKISETYYSQQADIENERLKIEAEEKLYAKREENHHSPYNDIKKLWKKLISKFHPDLVQDKEEKKNRDMVMKQINRAFQEGDYEQLVKIDKENLSQEENTVDDLENILLNVVNEITQQTSEYKLLKASEWFGWMEKINKAKKKSLNIFADTEKRLLDDITTKFAILRTIKQQIQNKDKSFTS